MAETRKSLQARVVRELTERPGMIVYLDDIVNATGLTPQQVVSAIYALRQRNEVIGSNVEVVLNAQAWRYRPNAIEDVNDPTVGRVDNGQRSASSGGGQPVASARPLGDVYERIGDDRTGRPIVRDTDGKLYALEEL